MWKPSRNVCKKIKEIMLSVKLILKLSSLLVLSNNQLQKPLLEMFFILFSLNSLRLEELVLYVDYDLKFLGAVRKVWWPLGRLRKKLYCNAVCHDHRSAARVMSSPSTISPFASATHLYHTFIFSYIALSSLNTFRFLSSNIVQHCTVFILREMKSYIWLQTTDGSIQQVEQEVAMFCPMICQEVLQTGMGSSKNYAIKLPPRVNPAVLGLILEYCRFHQLPGHSDKELKTYDEKFIRLDTQGLCQLISAADSLKLRSLVDLTSRALARIIEGKTPEEIRETFHIPDDLTEEEKLEPLRNVTGDPRIRLLNRLYERKRKDLKEREKIKKADVAEELIDKRSVDDLLSFINGGDSDPKRVTTSKKKKKNRRQNDQPRNITSNSENENHGKALDSLKSESHNGQMQDVSSSIQASVMQDSPSATVLSNFDEEYVDEEMDPAVMEEIDREVEDFARRINSVWSERQGNERRRLPVFIHGDSFVARYTG
ncbi:S-phase kinase-associated protein 1-like [Heracleum sosnowskyi]|uniref:S-phase kinase-associated protein 1-like n=1 Tax=Heracleum sosnowskyi TaxID=360622 RepID=A0AAD8HFL0_9APIA|nr:S-phase kinase-associated protein 1-like [Heracleum sosnowskyi]